MSKYLLNLKKMHLSGFLGRFFEGNNKKRTFICPTSICPVGVPPGFFFQKTLFFRMLGKIFTQIFLHAFF